MLQDELAQESFHTRLACALQGGVSLGQGKLSSCWAPGTGRGVPEVSRQIPRKETTHSRDKPSSAHMMV